MGNKSDINKIVKNFLEVQIDCIKEIQEQSETIDKIIKIIISTKNKNKTIFTMGNGGSGSTASHFASDLQKTTILKNENRIKSISLVDNMPLILAWANDVSFESIFEEQLKTFSIQRLFIITEKSKFVGNIANILVQLSSVNHSYSEIFQSFVFSFTTSLTQSIT